MVWSHFEPSLFGSHLGDFARLAACNVRDGRFLEVAIDQRPQTLTGTHEPSWFRTFDGIHDLVARHAQREEVDVLHDDHLVIVFDEQRVVQDVLDFLFVPGGEILQRGGDAFRRLRQALALYVLAQFVQKLLDELFDHRASRMQRGSHGVGSTSVWTIFAIMRPRPGTRTGSWPSPPP